MKRRAERPRPRPYMPPYSDGVLRITWPDSFAPPDTCSLDVNVTLHREYGERAFRELGEALRAAGYTVDLIVKREERIL